MKEERRCGIGIDFGGTSVKVGLVGDHGNVIGRDAIDTSSITSREAWLDAMAETIEGLCTLHQGDMQLAGAGVGVPGFVDFETGFIYELPNVPGWKEVELGRLLRDRLGMPVFVDNDVNVMAQGEGTFGAGRLYQHAVFATLGTGVGGALLIQNKLYRGAHSMAGEIGHMSIDYRGIQSPQGIGGVEQYVGNRRLTERVRKQLEEGRESVIRDLVGGDLDKLEPRYFSLAAQQGDALAIETYEYMAECLSCVFASISYLIQPQVFIIGGGVAEGGGDLLFDALRQAFQRRVSPVFFENIEIIPAELGNTAGMIGGATLALLSA